MRGRPRGGSGPAAFACQTSTSAPRIGRPSSSSTRPVTMMRSPSGSPSCCRVRSLSSSPTRPSPKTGPVELVQLLRQRDERPVRARASASSGSRGSRAGPRGRTRDRPAGRPASLVGHCHALALRLERAQRRELVVASAARSRAGRRRRAAPSPSRRATSSTSTPRMHGDERQLAVARLEDAEVGDDDADVVADARREVELLDERARRVAEHHEDFSHRRRDLGRAAAARQAHLRLRRSRRSRCC